MPIRPKSRAASPSASSPIPLIVASLFVLLVVAATLARRLPQAVILIYGFVSILTFLVYWYDKSAARNGQWRTKESSLLFLGLVGDGPVPSSPSECCATNPESVLFRSHSGEPS